MFRNLSVNKVDFWLLIYISSVFLIFGNFRPIVEILSVLGICWNLPRLKINVKPYFIWGIVFCSYSLVSIMWSHDSSSTIYSTRGTTECFLCGMVIQMCLEDDESFMKVVNYTLFSCATMILTILLTIPMSEITSRRFGGLYNANNIGIRCAICFVIMLWKLKNGKKKTSIEIVFSCFLATAAVLTGSKKAIIIIVFGIILLRISYSNDFIESIKHILGSVIIIIAVYYLILNNSFLYSIIGNRVEGMISGLQNGADYGDPSTKDRMNLIELAYDGWKNKPLLGYGANSFASTIGYKGYGNNGLYTHNNYLEIMFGLGVVGIVFYYSIIIVNIIKLKRNRNKNYRVLNVCLIAIILFVDTAMVSYGDEFIQFLLAISCSLSFLDETRYALKEEEHF